MVIVILSEFLDGILLPRCSRRNTAEMSCIRLRCALSMRSASYSWILARLCIMTRELLPVYGFACADTGFSLPSLVMTKNFGCIPNISEYGWTSCTVMSSAKLTRMPFELVVRERETESSGWT